MNDPKDYITHYIARLIGPERDDAFHSLVEADNIVVPYLIDAFKGEQNIAVRTELIEIIWQHRLPETIEFLSDVLDDKNPEIWKRALDGLVSIGGLPAIDAILSAQQRPQRDQQRMKWLNEALEQIKS